MTEPARPAAFRCTEGCGAVLLIVIDPADPGLPAEIAAKVDGHVCAAPDTEPPPRNPRLAHFEPYGHGLLLAGHDIPRTEVERELDLAHGSPPPGQSLQTSEQFLHEQRRVKWCSRHGDPCDLDGEWHTHWHALQPTERRGAQFTFAYYGHPEGS